MISKPKAIYFYQYLPPWRIDVFNEMANMFDLTIVFWNSECEGFTYDRQGLLRKLDASIETIFLNNGIEAGTHSIRRGVLGIIRSRRPQVVFSHEYAPISMQCVLYRMLGMSKYQLYLTTSDNLKMAESSSGLKRAARDFILRHADGAILYSRDVQQWYQQRFPGLKTDVCPNIQNPQSLLSLRPQFGPIIVKYQQQFDLEGKKVLLFTGRLNPVKGLDLLLNAFAESQSVDWVLVLVGSGQEEQALKMQAKELGIADRVVFAGFYNGINLYAWYELANFFILPSRYEPFGAVVNEALVYGCPVVTSRYIGALDFVTDQNGMVFDPLDAVKFVNTLNIAFERYAIRQAGRENCMTVSFWDSVRAFERITRSDENRLS